MFIHNCRDIVTALRAVVLRRHWKEVNNCDLHKPVVFSVPMACEMGSEMGFQQPFTLFPGSHGDHRYAFATRQVGS